MLLIQEFTEAMGGSVTVESKTADETPEASGTSVTIELPSV